MNAQDIAKVLSPELLQFIADDKGFKWFDKGDFNLNYWGIRTMNLDRKEDLFDDLFVVAYKDGGQWQMKTFAGTTKPGLWEMMQPSFQEARSGGVACLVEGQWLNKWEYGMHGNGGNFDHYGLLQRDPYGDGGKVAIYRDDSFDAELNLDLNKITYGHYWINHHSTKSYYLQPNVCNFSAGCQVHQDYNLYTKVFIPLLLKSLQMYGNSFSYTLIRDSDLAEYL